MRDHNPLLRLISNRQILNARHPEPFISSLRVPSRPPTFDTFVHASVPLFDPGSQDRQLLCEALEADLSSTGEAGPELTACTLD
jgi:hypothetical protein